MRNFVHIAKQIFYTVFSFCYFLGLAVEMTVRGFFLITLGGATDEHKRKYHRILQRKMRFAVNNIPGTQFKFSNIPGETFEKPSIIICNHQSHLDLAAIIMLTPNLIILTKNWVWHNPFYGVIIRYADFFPISETEKMSSNLEAMVEKGYSVMVFPEGSRSPDCRIRRFHSGAFYLAERLNLDIVPIYISGFGKVLPKESFLLHEERMSLEILPRILRNDPSWSMGYREMTKKVHSLYVKRNNEEMCNYR